MSDGQYAQEPQEIPEEQAKPRVLVVDDQRLNLNVLHGLLKDDYQVMVASSGEQCLKAATNLHPDLILLDINMPDLDGYEVCQRLKQDPGTMKIPIIFITAMSDSEEETRGLQLGAMDYITKPFHAAVVQARVRMQIRLKQHSDMLESYALRDGLTGLSNRRAFDERSNLEWNRCRRSSTPLSVLMIDVDHFKLYNDSYGHGKGDECLHSVARALSFQIRRASDMLARYGGEEFVVLLPDTGFSAALAVGEKLREAVVTLGLEHRASKVAAHVTLSVGVATMVPTAESRLQALLEHADSMLYDSKAAGRNCVRGVEVPGSAAPQS